MTAHGLPANSQDRAADSTAQSVEFFCPACGYSLQGITSERCPECGLAIDRELTSKIPWVHRKQIGLIRAYFRAMGLAIFRPKTLAREIARPVSLRDAERFRRATALLAFLPPFIVIAWTLLRIPVFDSALISSLGDLAKVPDTPTLTWSQMFLLAAVTLAWGLFIYGVSGLPSYWFHPRSLPMARQNRAVALSFYACAPLPLFTAALSLFAVCVVQTNVTDSQAEIWVILPLAFGFISVALFLSCVLLPARLLAIVTQRSLRAWLMPPLLLIGTLLLGAVCFLLPAGVLFLELVWATFH